MDIQEQVLTENDHIEHFGRDARRLQNLTELAKNKQGIKVERSLFYTNRRMKNNENKTIPISKHL